MANKKDDWIPWALGGAAVLAAFWYITNQKAGAPMGQPQPQANAPQGKEGGCGCEMEPGTESQPQSQAQVASSDVTGVPSTG